jgi:hypothetical protein
MLYVFGAYDVYSRTDLAVSSERGGREGLGCCGESDDLVVSKCGAKHLCLVSIKVDSRQYR